MTKMLVSYYRGIFLGFLCNIATLLIKESDIKKARSVTNKLYKTFSYFASTTKNTLLM